jgi:hypothetical protein
MKSENKNKKKDDDYVYVFSEEKLDEFRHVSVHQRLQWLEEANAFINKTIGFKKRAHFDKRFEGLGKK